MPKVEFLPLPIPGAPKDDPRFFRLRVSAPKSKIFIHDFLISTVLGTTQSELKRLGAAIQKRLLSVHWENNPEHAFNKEIMPLLDARSLDSDSQLLAKEISDLGNTYTSIGIANLSDFEQLMERFAH